MKILIIEDDEVLSDILVQSLSKQHYVVETINDGELGWEYAQGTNYDLIITDVGLPKLDGISLCRKLRSSGCLIPILLMTAKDATSDRIRGLDAGADDYLVKPVDLGELQARVRALLRRGDVPRNPILEIGALRLDPGSCEVTYQGKLLDLTPKEYNLLELLMRNPQRVFSRSKIIEHLWTYDDPPQEETVKSHIKWLRQKLKALGAGDLIENVYGLGYRLNSNQLSVISNQGETQQTDLEKGEHLNSELVVQQFREAMGGLWEQYQGLMLERLEILQEANNTLIKGKLSSDLRQKATQAAHKLAGVLGMFELEKGTELARDIETILGDHSRLSQKKRDQVQKSIQKLTELLGQAQGNLQQPMITPVRSSTPNLLIIDDDQELWQNLAELMANGLIYQQISSINKVTSYLQNRLPDIVIIDIDQDREASLGLIADLARKTPTIAIITLTDTDTIAQRVAVARAGGQSFLVKPVTIEKIKGIILQILQQRQQTSVKILAVDDDPVILQTLDTLLTPWGIQVTGLQEPLHFWLKLEEIKPDLLILDVEMPELTGIELCQAVRTDSQWQKLPIFFLTGHRDVKTVQQLFTAGADDYLLKPVVGAELISRILNRLERNYTLQKFSSQDYLTGLLNQSQSSKELTKMLLQAQENSDLVSLAILCVSELRQINIQYGHEAGNQVLQTWGRILQTAFNRGEMLAYWGHGEFAIAMPGLTKIEARERLDEVLISLRQQIFTAPQRDRFQAMCSFSVVTYPQNGLTLQALYQAASSIRHQ